MSGRDDSHVTKLDRLLGVSASSQPAGQLLYLIPLALPVKSAVRDDFSVSGQHSSTASEEWDPILDPKVLFSLGEVWDEVVLRLRGQEAFRPFALPCGANK